MNSIPRCYVCILLTIISLSASTLRASAQRRVSYKYTEVSKAEYNACNKVSYLSVNSQIKKKSGSLAIPVSGKPAKVFKDDSSGLEFHAFDYLGDIKGTLLSLIKRTDYNSEEFYLLNRSNGTLDTLIGQPVFALNRRDFICINNPGTDKKQQIQVCEMNNSTMRTRGYLDGKAGTFLEAVSCITRNSVMAKDNTGGYWRLSFKMNDK